MNTYKLWLLLALLASLAACGGSSGGSSSSAASHSSSSSSSTAAFACDPELYDKAMALRIYQVMVESFINGNPDIGHGVGYGTSHHQGDIQGITDSLPYIQSLGFNALWLTPVFESVPLPEQGLNADRLDATGYYASNFFAIDPNFGTLEELRTLVDTAHSLGLYVLFDGVFGHFKNNAHHYPSPSGLTLSTHGTPIGGTLGREAVYPDDLAFFQEVASYWITELGIDGWRLDQAYQVPTDAWVEIRRRVEEASASVTYQNAQGETVNPLGYLVAEIWDSAQRIAQDAYGPADNPALCSAFDFPLRYALVRTLAVEENGERNPTATNLAAGFATHFNYPEHAIPNGFVGNHDLVRFGDLLQRGDIAQPDDDSYWLRHQAAYSFLAAYSGPITLYYGEEIGQEVPGFAQPVTENCADQGLCDDHVARDSGQVEGLPSGVDGEPFSANSQQAALRDYLTQLLHLRAQQPALYKGTRTSVAPPVELASDIYIDHKAYGDQAIVYLLNVSEHTRELTLDSCTIGSQGTLTDLLADTVHSLEDDRYSLTLPPLGSAFLRIDTPSTQGPGCGGDQGPIGTGPLAECHAPDVDGEQPLSQAIYIRGNYTGGSDFSATPANRQFRYKGNRIYQVVVNEPSASSYAFKFATSNWSREYAVAGSAPVILGTEQPMVTASGPGTESLISIPEPGNYVFSFEINETLTGGTMMVSQCP